MRWVRTGLKKPSVPAVKPLGAAEKKSSVVSGIPVTLPRPLVLPALIEAVKEDDVRDDSYLHASSLEDYCPRMQVILHVFGLRVSKPELSLNLKWTMELGKMIHTTLQNRFLGRRGVLVGKWKCLACEHRVGRDMPNEWVRMPDPGECPALSTFSGRERPHLWVHDECHAVDAELGIGGDIDGGIRHSNGEIVGLEIKSISADGHNRLRGVKADHIVQANVYMMLFGLRQQVFVYTSKGWHDEKEATVRDAAGGWRNGPFYEVSLKRDERVIADFVLKRRSEQTARADMARSGGECYPPRLERECASEFTGRAKACPVKDLCFSLAAE
jgi:hypothetical protein